MQNLICVELDRFWLTNCFWLLRIECQEGQGWCEIVYYPKGRQLNSTEYQRSEVVQVICCLSNRVKWHLKLMTRFTGVLSRHIEKYKYSASFTIFWVLRSMWPMIIYGAGSSSSFWALQPLLLLWASLLVEAFSFQPQTWSLCLNSIHQQQRILIHGGLLIWTPFKGVHRYWLPSTAVKIGH